MTNLVRIAVTALAATLLLVACGESTMDSSGSLEGQWEIEQIADEDGALVPPVDGTSPFLSFRDTGTEDSTMSGHTGCNSLSGPVEVDADGTFAAGTFAMTLIGCPDEVGEQEGRIVTNLADADTWAVDGDAASLSAQGSVVLVLRRMDTSLEGSFWVVTGINNQKGGVQSVVTGTEPTLWFEVGGNLAGTTGCNNLMSSYVVDGPTVEIAPVATTRKFCSTPPGVMDQEQNMIAALDNAATYEINGLTLTLRDADGSTMLNAQRGPEPTP